MLTKPAVALPPDPPLDHIHLWRNPARPYERHLLPDFEMPVEEALSDDRFKRRIDIFQHLPAPPALALCQPQWNSVALFFNLPAAARPSDYQETTVQDVRNWLDEGVDPANPTISQFMCNYWRTLSYGHLAFGLNIPRTSSGAPLIPTIDAPGGNTQDFSGLINACLEANAEAIWQAAGCLTLGGKRWIPSLVLVQHYGTQASAFRYGYELTVGGKIYVIGDTTHISYNLDFVDLPGVPAKSARGFWGTLCHEYSHNFLEFGDLYGPEGCTGYWDLLGDNSPPGRMSEVCSVHKQRVGWLDFMQVIQGPSFPAIGITLRPYTTSGEAIKVVPDPEHNPSEYFVLEYRKNTGNETWRPDRALTEEGLWIAHINERLGVSGLWLLRDAPYFDPEFADFSDNGGALWTGHDRLTGVLFPHERNYWFTRFSSPNSNFYGGRSSGLSITNIRVERDTCKFLLQIQGNPRVGWTVSAKDRCVVGRFTDEAATNGEEIFCRNDKQAALLVHRQAQWLVEQCQGETIGGWPLGADDHEVVGDFDGDGKDELYIRTPHQAGILKWNTNRFLPILLQSGSIGDWHFGTEDREVVGDFDGDHKDELYLRSPDAAGMVKLINNQLQLQWHANAIDGLPISPDDSEFVGRFSQTKHDELLIFRPDALALCFWDTSRHLLRQSAVQNGALDGWQFLADDHHLIGDFDADGKDEIYIRSANAAGLIKWVGNKFRLLWQREHDLEHINGDANQKIALQSNDLSYAGRFLPERAGVLHRNDNSVAVLTWENNAMQIRHHITSPFNLWRLGVNDKFVLGDFQRVGRDIADPHLDFVQDHLTNIFIHNSWGTGMISVNHAQWNPAAPNDIHSEIGLTWINQGELLFRKGVDTMPNVTKYNVAILGTKKNYVDRAFIVLYNDSTQVGRICFRDPDIPIPDDTGGNYITMYLPSTMFANVIDLLRNEKPIIIDFSDSLASLVTQPEPVGEGE